MYSFIDVFHENYNYYLCFNNNMFQQEKMNGKRLIDYDGEELL